MIKFQNLNINSVDKNVELFARKYKCPKKFWYFMFWQFQLILFKNAIFTNIK